MATGPWALGMVRWLRTNSTAGSESKSSGGHCFGNAVFICHRLRAIQIDICEGNDFRASKLPKVL